MSSQTRRPIDISCFITGSIARSARRRYLSYPESILRLFAPQGRHVAPMEVKFGVVD